MRCVPRHRSIVCLVHLSQLNTCCYCLISQALRTAPAQHSPPVVRVRHRRLDAELDCDVAVCGGTLGLFLGLALQLRGHRVTVVEKRRVEGRAQEWNVSRQELNVRVPRLSV